MKRISSNQLLASYVLSVRRRASHLHNKMLPPVLPKKQIERSFHALIRCLTGACAPPCGLWLSASSHLRTSASSRRATGSLPCKRVAQHPPNTRGPEHSRALGPLMVILLPSGPSLGLSLWGPLLAWDMVWVGSSNNEEFCEVENLVRQVSTSGRAQEHVFSSKIGLDPSSPKQANRCRPLLRVLLIKCHGKPPLWQVEEAQRLLCHLLTLQPCALDTQTTRPFLPNYLGK
ncbi:hypothetical protein F4780DRAFT_574505 [Xylariomycetidae sp. FL0641]|nr:hypothetical protein F4780DRAFT_574505 [Xylariomycetidae sp. FL0641]